MWMLCKNVKVHARSPFLKNKDIRRLGSPTSLFGIAMTLNSSPRGHSISMYTILMRYFRAWLGLCIFFRVQRYLVGYCRLYVASNVYCVDYRRAVTGTAIIGLCVAVAANLFTAYAIYRPRYVLRRLAGCLQVGTGQTISTWHSFLRHDHHVYHCLGRPNESRYILLLYLLLHSPSNARAR